MEFEEPVRFPTWAEISWNSHYSRFEGRWKSRVSAGEIQGWRETWESGPRILVMEAIAVGEGLRHSSLEIIALSFLHTCPAEMCCQGTFCAGRVMKDSFASERELNYLPLNQQLLSHYS